MKLTLYKCPRSAPCASVVGEQWHHGAAHHAKSSWAMPSVGRSGCSAEQNSHTARRRDECIDHLTTGTRPLRMKERTHTDHAASYFAHHFKYFAHSTSPCPPFRVFINIYMLTFYFYWYLHSQIPVFKTNQRVSVVDMQTRCTRETRQIRPHLCYVAEWGGASWRCSTSSRSVSLWRPARGWLRWSPWCSGLPTRHNTDRRCTRC